MPRAKTRRQLQQRQSKQSKPVMSTRKNRLLKMLRKSLCQSKSKRTVGG